MSNAKYFIFNDKGSDYCSVILSKTKNAIMTGPVAVYVGNALLFFVTLLPYMVYFVIITYWEPHDCFNCFNRLSNTRYSIFQYTLTERNVFRENKIGMGFVN